MLRLPRSCYDKIVAQGLEGKPLEICGFLFGPRAGTSADAVTEVSEAYPVESDDKSELTYSMNPGQMVQALKHAREQGLEVVGIYHTHPATQPYPSITDVSRAHWGDSDDLNYPGCSYLIVSLRDVNQPEPRSYKIEGRRIPEDIVEETVEIVSDEKCSVEPAAPPRDGRAAEMNGHARAPMPVQCLAVNAVSIEDYIGNTPLFKFHNINRHLKHVEIYGKAEYLNPGGSVKDRAASNMILSAEKSGELTKDKIILDSTSGNTGIAYAMIGAAKGYKVKLVMPGNVSIERRQIVAMYGAEVVLSDQLLGSDGAIILAREIYEQNPDIYFKPDQYNNPSNAAAHYMGTGPEIWSQTRQRVTHFLATIGTSGTLMGTGKFLKDQNPNIQVIAVEPDSPMHGIEGLKHMASSLKPGLYDERAHDDKIPAPTEEAYDMQARLAAEEGIFVGFSAGAAVWASLQLANKLEAEGREAVIVTILCDRGDRYLQQLAKMSAG